MFILDWSNGTCDPEHGITPLFHSGNCGAGGNRAFLRDDKIDAMIGEVCSETDNEKRIRDYKDISRLPLRRITHRMIVTAFV